MTRAVFIYNLASALYDDAFVDNPYGDGETALVIESTSQVVDENTPIQQ